MQINFFLKKAGTPKMEFNTITYRNNKLYIIDQRLLPLRLKIIEARNIKDVYNYIKSLAVRGAPAIGVFAAYGVLVGLKDIKTNDKNKFFIHLDRLCNYVKKSRPTAVNLSWALDCIVKTAQSNRAKSLTEIKKQIVKKAKAIHKEDMFMCEKIGINGARLVKKHDRILTHCNAGFLATGGIGTALGIIYKAEKQGKEVKVYADETRPLLQGARLTAWELKRNNIDITLICDNMAASLMKQGKIDKVIVGADRIAGNGDTANKTGTYALAVLAKAHNIPFYVAAPSSTIDLSINNGSQIPIEHRPSDEIRKVSGKYIAPAGIRVYNPAFDITPFNLITAIVTEKGIFKKPYMLKLINLART
jgi:methylthioribose-1-phosphate isomerase